MADNDFMNLMSDFWSKSGSAVSAAQQQFFKDAVDRMGHGFMFPLNAFTSRDLDQASEALQKLMAASLKLPEIVAQGSGSREADDGLTLELLQKIFDPREWLSATGYMDETVRRISEGPKLADLWQVEGKFLTLAKAWTETRTHSLEHINHVVAAWTKAVAEFSEKLTQQANSGLPLGSRSEIVALWVETANHHLLEAQRSPAFLETQRSLLKASADLRLAQQDLGEFYSDALGLPTRSEFDDLAKAITELRREFRADKRQLSRQTKN